MTKKLVNIDGVLHPKGKLSAQELVALRREIRRAKKRENELRKDYKKAVDHGSMADQRKQASRYLRSAHTRKVAVLRANAKLKLKYRAPLKQCMKIAKAMKAHKPSGEHVKVRFKPKGSGGTRPICRFGVRNKALQCLVEPIIATSFKPKPWQFSFKGMHAAIKSVISLQPEKEMWTATLDIKEFFPNCTLPVVKSVTRSISKGARENVLLVEKLVLRHMDGSPLYGNYLFQARRGIAQGSVVSPLVAATVVSQLNPKLSDGVHLFGYADDFLLVASDKDAMETAILALSASVDAIPGGQLSLKLKEFCQFTDGIEFLGHYLKVENGEWDIAPSKSALDRMGQNLDELTVRARKAIQGWLVSGSATLDKVVLESIGAVVSFQLSWLSAFSCCDPNFLKEIKTDFDIALYALLDLAKLTASDLEDYIHELPSGATYAMLNDLVETDLVAEAKA